MNAFDGQGGERELPLLADSSPRDQFRTFENTQVLQHGGAVEFGARTLVTISEGAWHVSADGAKNAFGNNAGWTGMLAALKMWLEHGINLRDGFYD